MRTPFLISSDASARREVPRPGGCLLVLAVDGFPPRRAASIDSLAQKGERTSGLTPALRTRCAMPHTPFNPHDHIHHLDGMDLSDAEKVEFVRTLWLIAQCFVDDAYSGSAEGPRANVVALKSGFEAANVIDLSSIKKTCAAAANDNASSRAKREPRTRGKRA